VGIESDPRSGDIIAINHSGLVFGFSAQLSYFPATDTALAVLTNGDAGAAPQAVMTSLRLAIPRLLDGPQSPLATAADL
jgi:hypothetical protein